MPSASLAPTWLPMRSAEVSPTLAPPSLIRLPEGCKFRPRCPHAFEKCKEEPPLENRVGTPGHFDRCWLDVEFKRGHRDQTISGGSVEAA